MYVYIYTLYIHISQFSVFLLMIWRVPYSWSALAGGVSGASHTLSQLCWCIHPIAALGPALASGGCVPGLMLREKGEVRRIVFLDTIWLPCKCRVRVRDHSACSPHEFCSKVWDALKDWRDWRKLLRESVAQRWWMPRRHTVSILGMNVNMARTTRMFWHFTYFSKISHSHSCSFTFTIFQG